jgi:hypothetical protein
MTLANMRENSADIGRVRECETVGADVRESAGAGPPR